MPNTKRAYLNYILYPYNLAPFDFLKKLAAQYGSLTIGIPSDYVMARLYGEGRNGYTAAAVRDFWKEFKFIDDIVILDDRNFGYQEMWERLKFDVCFYGSEYGSRFEADKKFMAERGVDFVSLVPNSFSLSEGINAVALYLQSARIQKKVVAFGSGAFYDRLMGVAKNCFLPAYIVDNDSAKWGTFKNGVEIKSPEAFAGEKEDGCVVIVCAKDSHPIVNQIRTIKNFDYRTLSFLNEIALLENFDFCKTRKELDDMALKRVQDINYKMLEAFDSVCRRNNIEYFVNYGTLLGAIRHKGFIPWDNDVDTIMKRDECLKLFEHRNEFSDDYYWLADDLIGDKKYFDSVPRLGYKNAYIKKTDGSDVFYENFYNGIHLDMFAVDRTYDNFLGRLQRYELALLYGMMNAYRHKSMFFDYDKKMRFYNSILCAFGKFIPLKWLKKRADKVARRFNNDKKAPYWFISNCALCKLWLLFPKETFDKPPVNLQFGNLQVSASAEHDAMCKKIFGDYMQLPPVEQRIPHCGREYFSADLFVFNAPAKRGIKS